MKIVLISKDSKRSQQIYDTLSKYDIEWVKNPEVIESTLNRVNPDWVFIYHWSYIIPKRIYSRYRLVCFHTGNLPKDRGGSPIQNQIQNMTLMTAVIDSERKNTRRLCQACIFKARTPVVCSGG